MQEITVAHKSATELAQAVQSSLGSLGIVADVTVMAKSKINETEQLALTITEPGRSVNPSITVDHLLEDLKDGQITLSSATEEVIQSYQKAMISLPEIPSLKKEDVLPNLRTIVVNTATNEELLKNVPSVKVHDLSIIPIYQVGDEAHVKVTNSLCAHMELTPSEVLEAAIGVAEKQPYKILSLSDQIRSIVGEDEMAAEMLAGNSGPKMYVLTNTSGTLGASNFFVNPAMQQEIIDRMEGPAVIIPSSTHELLAISASDVQSFDGIDAMIRDVNATQLAPDEYLSDHCYLLGEDLSLTCPTVAEDMVSDSTESLSSGMHI